MIASAGMPLIAFGLVMDGWFSPPASKPSFLFLVLSRWFWCRKLSKLGNLKVLKSRIRSCRLAAPIANIEVLMAVLNGLCVMTVLGMEVADSPKLYRQDVTIVTLVLIVITFVASRFTQASFDALLRAAGLSADPNFE